MSNTQPDAETNPPRTTIPNQNQNFSPGLKEVRWHMLSAEHAPKCFDPFPIALFRHIPFYKLEEKRNQTDREQWANKVVDIFADEQQRY
jgi:hypothetical protein